MDKIEKDILDYKIAEELTWVPWATNFKNTLEQVQLALESIGYTLEIKTNGIWENEIDSATRLSEREYEEEANNSRIRENIEQSKRDTN